MKTSKNEPDLSDEHVEKWLNADRFLRAKKCIDSLLYAGEMIKPPNVNKFGVSGVDIRERVIDLRRTFYIECGNLLDRVFSGKHSKGQKSDKQSICERDAIIMAIYYERDKNSAHADRDYRAPEFFNLTEMARVMKKQLKRVRRECASILPQNITINHVSFDPWMARFIHGVSPEKEAEALKKHHPFYIGDESDLRIMREEFGLHQIAKRKNFVDLYQLSEVLAHRDEYCVLFQSKLFKNEELQAMQDGCVRVNILYGHDMWVRPGHTFAPNETDQLLKELGFIDEFDQFVFPRFLGFL